MWKRPSSKRNGTPSPSSSKYTQDVAQLAGEHDLRRVLDEEREVEGLGEQELLEIYRSMVLLRTYDERSLVYHRQGRIGTYAIFWNHEAMQAGSVHALADRDWIFPSYRESAIGLLRGIPAATALASPRSGSESRSSGSSSPSGPRRPRTP